MTTRIGVLGAGVIARRHVRTLAAFDDVRVVAVADPDRDRGAALAATVGATPYGDASQLLDAERLDAVYVCVPPFAHGGLELSVIERGLPLFVEKPLAADLATAERVAARVEEQGLVTGVGHHWRWLDIVERAQELLADRPVRLATGYWLDATPPIGWWQKQDLSGGQFVEQATHVVDLARLLAGDIEEVFGYASRSARPAYPDADVFDVTAATARFAAGGLASFTATCVLAWPHRVGLHLFAEGLALELTEKELAVDTGGRRTVWRASGDPFVHEDRAFVDAVQGGADRTRTTYAEALRTHRVTTGVLRSAELGRPVQVGADGAAGGSGAEGAA